MPNELPSTVRYVKNGPGGPLGGKWWVTAKERAQLHAGWKIVPDSLLSDPNYSEIEAIIRREIQDQGAAKRDYNALCHLLQAPSRHLWLTFEERSLWWCTVKDGAHQNPNKNDTAKGNFWLECDRPWSKISLNGKQLSVTTLPGVVTTVSGFRATVCIPRAQEEIRRAIKGEVHPDVTTAATKRNEFEGAVAKIISLLRWWDFEELIELILARTGWQRTSKVGDQQKGIDIDAENPAIGEIAFVQVKSEADQAVLDSYVQQFTDQRDRYARMIFAMHSARELTIPSDLPVQVWGLEHIAELVVKLGLAEWVERKVA